MDGRIHRPFAKHTSWRSHVAAAWSFSRGWELLENPTSVAAQAFCCLSIQYSDAGTMHGVTEGGGIDFGTDTEVFLASCRHCLSEALKVGNAVELGC